MRIRYQRAWRNRPHPYYFARRYSSGLRVLHVGPVEVSVRRTWKFTDRAKTLAIALAVVAVVWYISGVDTAWWTDNPLPIR